MAEVDTRHDIRRENDMDPRVIAYRLNLLENAVLETTRALTGINVSLQTLATLEVRHTETRDALTRAFNKLDDHEKRIASVELKMPVLSLTSQWVRAGVLGLFALVAIAVIKLVILH